MINDLFKILSVISIISGAFTGILALVPFLSFPIICIIMFAFAPFIIIYFKHLKLIENIEIDKGILYGGISGFMGFIGFSVIFFPFAFVIDLIFKTQTFMWVNVVFKNFTFLIGMVILAALLSALLNMFTGFLTAYLYQYLKK